jgi:signal transduction histidine kinase
MDNSIKKGVFFVAFFSLVISYLSYFMLSEHEAEVLLITSTLSLLVIGFYIKEVMNFEQDIDNIGHYYLLVDENASILSVSDALLTQKEFCTKKLSIGENLLSYILKTEFDHLNSGEKVGKAVYCKLPNGKDSKNIILINAGDADGQYTKLIVLPFEMKNNFHSLDDKLQHQKMLAIGQLTSGIAHDFNNILTAMRGYSDLILDSISNHSPIYDYSMQLKHNITRASFLSKQLLGFVKKQDVSYHNLDLYSVVLEISKLLARLIGEKIIINITKLNESNIITGNENLIEQIIINLALNAKDAMAKGGSLNISVSKTYYDKEHNFLDKLYNPCKHDEIVNGNYILLKVNDTGIGIKNDIIDKIFDPFFSSKDSSSLGGGLANVLGIVRQMNGHIFVESNNFGTSFYLIFAEVVSVSEQNTRASSSLSLDPDAKTILLVEDEEPVRVFSAHALRNKGYNILEAENAEQAMKIYSSVSKIDIVVSDVVMPGMNGNELVARLLRKNPELKVLLISGYTEDDLSLDIESDNIRFLSKPFSLKQLVDSVDFSKERELIV